MTNAAKSAAIALACGFRHEIDDKGYHWWYPPNRSAAFGYGETSDRPPDFFANHAACEEACKILGLYPAVHRDQTGKWCCFTDHDDSQTEIFGKTIAEAMANGIAQTPRVRKVLESEAENE